ncbi:hypothetical protein ACFZAG_15045 [Streptomyces sp. NPDC012403]|uniref:hypothetical protein n=1 Tax=Streptomyces sp. NPDC012403 TaxID=3364831 RepID=UPI0036E12774
MQEDNVEMAEQLPTLGIRNGDGCRTSAGTWSCDPKAPVGQVLFCVSAHPKHPL